MYASTINAASVGSGLVQAGAFRAHPEIGFIAFNDPARMNAMSETMADDFREGVETLGSLESKAVVVTGAGRAFSAGGCMDMIRKKQKQTAEINSEEMLAFYRSFLDIRDLRIPIVAAINGAAIGAGLCFACACDRRIAADIDRNILGFSFVKLGLTPGMGGTVFPKRLVGAKKAGDMLGKGYNITPSEAFEIGMMEMIVPQRLLMDYAVLAALRFAEKPNDVLARRVGWAELKDGLIEEVRLQGASFLTPNHRMLFERFVAQMNG